MKTKRFQQYLQQRNSNSPMRNQQQVANSKDQKIDEDFPGYPGGHAKKEIIQPKTATEKKTAALDTKDGEKMNSTPAKRKSGIDEQQSDGSGGAFGATESVEE